MVSLIIAITTLLTSVIIPACASLLTKFVFK